MLINILKEIANSEVESYSSLAKRLNLEPEMVKQMFQNLQRMGYIISDGPACGDDKCDECGVCCTKKKKNDQGKNINTSFIRWKLTEKGKEAVLKNN